LLDKLIVNIQKLGRKKFYNIEHLAKAMEEDTEKNVEEDCSSGNDHHRVGLGPKPVFFVAGDSGK
jgi:hypothetical protein